MSAAQSDDQLRSIFSCGSEQESLLLETGFRKALPLLVCEDKQSIKSALRDHHSLVKIKPELDQFTDGLATLGLLKHIRKYPKLMEPLFVYEKKVLNKGTELKWLIEPALPIKPT